MEKERFIDGLIAEPIIWMVNRFRVKIEKDLSEEDLLTIREHLQLGSIMVPFNHLSTIDPPIIYRILNSKLESDMERFLIPASSKFFDGRMGLYGPILQYLQRKTKIKAFPVVQESDANPTMEKGVNTKALIPLLRSLGSPKTVLALSPEGTRSREGQMINAQHGLGFLIKRCIKKNKPVLVLPIGIAGSEGVIKPDSMKFNPFHKIAIFLGRPLSLTDLSQQRKKFLSRNKDDKTAFTDIVMLHIAQLLSQSGHPEYRGYYSPDNFSEFFGET